MAKITVKKNMTIKQLEAQEKKIKAENARLAKLNSVTKQKEALDKKK